jgi:hypothetical protein
MLTNSTVRRERCSGLMRVSGMEPSARSSPKPADTSTSSGRVRATVMDGRQSADVHGRVQGRGGSTGDGRGAPSASSSWGPGHSAQAATTTGCGGRRARRRPMSKCHQVRDIRAVDVYGSRGRTVQLGKLVPDTAHNPSQDLVQQVRRGSHYSAPISSDRRFFPTSFKVRTFAFSIDPYIGQSRKIFNQGAPRGCDANFTRC